MPQNQQESELREYIIETFALDMNSEVERAVVEQTVHLFTRLIAERELKIEKAYGGCRKCYGKGYSTVRDGIIGYEDFGGDGFKTPITTKMKFCTCGRGKQLAQLTAAEEKTKK